MTDTQFDILDELYFVISFQELKEKTNFSTPELQSELWEMLQQGWVKCFQSVNEEIYKIEKEDFVKQYPNLYFLATKAGLLAHNSR